MASATTTAIQKPGYRQGDLLPQFVLGTAGLGGAWGNIDRQESIESILFALEYGIKRLDTAPAYADAEEIVGEALKSWSGSQPFISTKVGKLKGSAQSENLNNYEISVMLKSVENSRKALDRSRLDLVFLHEPEKVPPAKVAEVLDFMQMLKQKGLTTQIGLGGNVPHTYHQAIKDKIFDVVMSFNNLNVCCIDGMAHDIPFFRAHDVQTYQGSALHMGLLGNRFESYTRERPSWLTKQAVANAKGNRTLADRSGMSLSSLAHRYLLSSTEVDFLVIGPRNMAQLKLTLKDMEGGKIAASLFDQINNNLVQWKNNKIR